MTLRRLPSLATAAAALLLALASPAAGAVVEPRVLCDPGVQCHELLVDLNLPSGRRAELSLRFEKVFFLTPTSLSITAQEVSPDDPSLTGRLPAGVFVNPRFPLLFTIERAPSASTKFHGQWTLELHTDAIDFEGETPSTRLFKAARSGAFADATQTVGLGSFRAGSTGGDFSEFLLVTDLRPPRRLALDKFDELVDQIREGGNDGQISPGAEQSLVDLVERARAAFTEGDARASLALLNEFTRQVVASSGVTVLDIWDPGAGKVSRAGILRGQAASLRLAVGLAARQRSRAVASVVRALTTPDGHRVEVLLSFPRQVGDLGAALDISATDVDLHDPALLARLPAGVALAPAFPVLVHIGPAAGGRPAFRGSYEVEFRTRDLEFAGNTRLRLFKGATGESFEDITSALGVGSFRVSGTGGDFSDFLIAVDRREPAELAALKLDRLEQILAASSNQIASSLLDQLTALLGQARSELEDGRLRQAIETLESFASQVDDNAGTGVPDLFRAGDTRTNVAGRLLSATRSLQLALTVARSHRLVAAP